MDMLGNRYDYTHGYTKSKKISNGVKRTVTLPLSFVRDTHLTKLLLSKDIGPETLNCRDQIRVDRA
jgi:hypothetical protein